ncbi:hypothetical protein HELRODRAFT_170000 [Helobdella robusta]|uniref:FERM domain-containing protein n=1 Tax=Helobdella robusta TaxID=6412 RepID=T1F2I7_HELRO|nr:hypothetical protein HELRODRAFT_170000 [Helobdella robusta]ESO07474.1 hypothetical protein HELRODRAFT_170000 [Helobdella robusta]
MTTNISNGKKLIVHLLDCSQIEVPINNKLSVDDVLQCVASNLSLTDTKYFGLCYHNEDSNNNNNNYYNNNYNGNSCLNQIVNRNYTDICNISDLMVIQQFYLHAKKLLAQLPISL